MKFSTWFLAMMSMASLGCPGMMMLPWSWLFCSVTLPSLLALVEPGYVRRAE